MTDLKEMMNNGKINIKKILDFGFVRPEGSSLYQYERLLDEDIALQILVSSDLSEIQTIVKDLTFDDEYQPFYSINQHGPVVNQIRELYQGVIDEFIEDCVTYPEQKHLIPEQIAANFVELNKLRLQVVNKEQQRETEKLTAEYKQGYSGEGIPTVTHTGTAEEIIAAYTRMDEILIDLKDSQLPYPKGNSVQYGSYVTYRRVSDETTTGKEYSVLVIQGGLSKVNCPVSDIKFASDGEETLGSALLGNTAGSLVDFDVNRQGQMIKNKLYIIDVDNTYIYDRYAFEYSTPEYKEIMSAGYSDHAESSTTSLEHGSKQNIR